MKTRLPWIAAAALPFFFGSYLLLTVPFGYPEEWDRIEKGMTRLEVCEAVGFPLEELRELDRAPDPTRLFRDHQIVKRGFRKWVLFLNFTEGKVSEITIFKHDLHEDFGHEGSLLL